MSGGRGLRPRVLAAGGLCLCVALAACGDDGVGPGESSIRLEVAGGDGQRRLSGERLPYPVVFRAVDGEGRPASGVPVRFEVVRGGGAAEPAAGVSDEQGRVKVRWRLGPGGVRTQRLSATLESALAAGGSPTGVTVQATAVGPEEADRVVVSGALGPLEGIVLFSDEGRIFDLILEKAAADTVVLLPPLNLGEVYLLVFSYGNRPLMQRVSWTSGQDTVRVTLKPPVAVDVKVNVYAGSFNERKSVITGQLARMEEVWVRTWGVAS